MELKTIRIDIASNGMYYAKYNGGGQMPKELTGLWTNYKDLEARINGYLARRKPQSKTQRAIARKPATARTRKKKED